MRSVRGCHTRGLGTRGREGWDPEERALGRFGDERGRQAVRLGLFPFLVLGYGEGKGVG